MLRFYLRLAVIPLIVLSAGLLIIRTQPYDDYELRRVLMPENCSAPCFMGIRPGITTSEEAIKIVSASEWVSQYVYEENRTIRIRWSEESPAWLVHNSYGSNFVRVEKNVVSEINLETHLSLGAIQLDMGVPPYQQVSLNDYYDHRFVYYSAFYTMMGLKITISRDCELGMGSITNLDKAYLNYAQVNTQDGFTPNYERSWFDVMGASCP